MLLGGGTGIGVAVGRSPIPGYQHQVAQMRGTLTTARGSLTAEQAKVASQRLIAMLIQDPPVPYAQISAKLGIPVGSIGPCRGRCLDKLRRHPAIAALIHADTDSPRDELHGQPVAR